MIKLTKSTDPEAAKRLLRRRKRRRAEKNAVAQLSPEERRAMVEAFCLEHGVVTQPFVPELMVHPATSPFSKAIRGRGRR
jgi:hypothetical protein